MFKKYLYEKNKMRLPNKDREVYYNLKQIERWIQLGLKYKVFGKEQSKENIKQMIEWIKLLKDSNILLE